MFLRSSTFCRCLIKSRFCSHSASAIKGAASAVKSAVTGQPAPAGAPAAGVAPAAAPAGAAPAAAAPKITKQHIEAYKNLMNITNTALKKAQGLQKSLPNLENDTTKWPDFQKSMEDIVNTIRSSLDIAEENIAKDLESRLIDKGLEAVIKQMSDAQDKIFAARTQKQPNIPEIKEAIAAFISALNAYLKLAPNAVGKMNSFLVRLGIREQREKLILKQMIQKEIKNSFSKR